MKMIVMMTVTEGLSSISFDVSLSKRRVLGVEKYCMGLIDMLYYPRF
jgi:hypothetical protein